MQYKIHTDPKRIIGKRPNLSAQNTVADNIVTAFTSQQEQPIVPLSSTATGKPSSWGKIFGTLAAVLLFAPFVISVVLMVIYNAQGYVLPLLMYPIYVLAFRNYSLFGGLALYLAARKANALRKPIGWIALANPLLTIPQFVYAILKSSGQDAALASEWLAVANLVSMIASLLCMIALCVFSVLMLVRVFKKKRAKVAE